MSEREKDLEKALEWASKRIETLTRENRELRARLGESVSTKAPKAVTLDDVITKHLGTKKGRGRAAR